MSTLSTSIGTGNPSQGNWKEKEKNRYLNQKGGTKMSLFADDMLFTYRKLKTFMEKKCQNQKTNSVKLQDTQNKHIKIIFVPTH